MEYYFRQKDDYFGKSTSVSVRFETDFIDEAVTKYREFLLGCGFDKELVDSYIPDPAAEDDIGPAEEPPEVENE